TTIDVECNSRAWGRIDFIKIDAEGGELAILRGGDVFFAAQSPLVMFERIGADGGNEGVQSTLQGCGYSLFKLIGPDLSVVPIGPDEAGGGFDLSLFACKPDRAEALSAAGRLTATCTAASVTPAGLGIRLWRNQDFARAFAITPTGLDFVYEQALDAYAAWRDADHSLAERCGALRVAGQLLGTLV